MKKCVDGVIVQMTDEEIAEYYASFPSEEQKILYKQERTREERNFLLAQSDWTQMPDATLTDQQKTAWQTYRQALRDITDHANFPYLADADWPTKPV